MRPQPGCLILFVSVLLYLAPTARTKSLLETHMLYWWDGICFTSLFWYGNNTPLIFEVACSIRVMSNKGLSFFWCDRFYEPCSLVRVQNTIDLHGNILVLNIASHWGETILLASVANQKQMFEETHHINAHRQRLNTRDVLEIVFWPEVATQTGASTFPWRCRTPRIDLPCWTRTWSCQTPLH